QVLYRMFIADTDTTTDQPFGNTSDGVSSVPHELSFQPGLWSKALLDDPSSDLHPGNHVNHSRGQVFAAKCDSNLVMIAGGTLAAVVQCGTGARNVDVFMERLLIRFGVGASSDAIFIVLVLFVYLRVHLIRC